MLSSRDAADILVGRASGDLDFRQWLAARRVRFYEGAEDAFAGALAESAARLPFVRRARVDLQTSLGGRKGAGGVDVAGALRETDDDIVGWQLRGYAAEHGSKGLNSGLFYRRVVGGALAGVNVFADYEDGDDGDFWRWSVGGDVKNRLGELSANRYFAITDAQVVGGENVYTREGYDVDFAVRIPRLEWAKARVGYYDFKGEFGDEDENGFRAGLDLSPGAGLVLGVEYDDDDGKFGGNISYTHHFGETQQESQRAGEFNPRAHFYDSVRREYSQRISRVGNAANGALIVNSGVNVGVFGDVPFTSTVVAASANINFAFPLTGTMVMATTQTTPAGSVTMRHQGGGWSLVVGENAEFAFSLGAVLNVARGRGTFERFGAHRLATVIMANTTLQLLGTKFDFDARANTAFVTLLEGGLSMQAANSVAVVVADEAFVRLYDGDTPAATVNCASGVPMTAGVSGKCEIANATLEVVTAAVTADVNADDVLIGRITLSGMDADISADVTPSAEFTVVKNGNGMEFNVSLLAAAATSADVNAKTARVTVSGGTLQTAREFLFTVSVNPLSITLDFVGGNFNSAPVTTTGDITIGTLEVVNGFNAQNINIVGARDYFRLESSDSDNRRLLILGGNNREARAVTVVLRGDDNENRTDAAMLTVTVMVVERVVLLGGGRVTVFAAADENEVVAVFQPVGGFPPYNNLNKLLPSGALPGGFQESAAAASVTITRTNTDLTAGVEHTIAYEVTETTMNGDSATATATVTVIASLSAQVMFAGGALTAGMAATVATISAAGGIGDYTFTTNNNAVSFVDGTIAIANFNNAGTISVNLIANDNTALTEPFTVAITLTVLNTAMAAPDNTTFREFKTGASVTLANLTYSGATGGDNVTATVITVQNGEGEVDGGELLVSSDMRGTSEVKIAVYDSVNDAAPKSTLTLSLEFVAPLTAVFADSPNFMPLTNTAAHITIATVTISGGDGEYGNPHLQVNMQDFAWSEGTILILNNTGGRNESERTVTAVISADDNSGISAPATISVTVNVADNRVILRGGGRITVLSAADENAVVAEFQPFDGVPPYSNLNRLLPSGALPSGLQESAAAASVTITRTNTDLTAGDEHIIAYEVRDDNGNGLLAAATATITVIAPLEAAFVPSRADLEFINDPTDPQNIRQLTLNHFGSLDVSMAATLGTLSVSGGASPYSFTETNTNVSIVANSIVVAEFNAGGFSTATIIADDSTPLTQPVSMTFTMTAFALLTVDRIEITVTTGSNPGAVANTPAFTVQPSGGLAPYTLHPTQGPILDPIPPNYNTPLFNEQIFEYRAANRDDRVIFFNNHRARSNPGLVTVADGLAIKDTNNRTFVFFVAINFVLPPPVTISVDQTVNSTPAGASSVSVATLTYSGGSTGGALTATVVGVKDGFGAVSDNEVLMSASAAGEVIATINAYDSTNATAPNATAQITVTFTGGG